MDLYPFDHDYVDRLRKGDPETEQHFASYFGQILGIMLRARMLSAERVDDVRQETFVRVIKILRRDDGIRQPERFGAFVNSICKNVLHERNRDWYRNQPLEDSHLEKSNQDCPDKIIDVEATLITNEQKKKVGQILDEMNKSDRQLLCAIFLEEKDKDEICKEFGVDRDYLRVRLHRAKERFRVLYEKEGGGLPKPPAKGSQ